MDGGGHGVRQRRRRGTICVRGSRLAIPFHPATLSVFHRKWQALRQFQQTRGALAMFAQWISYVYKDAHHEGAE